jgi:hypothetical protein
MILFIVQSLLEIIDRSRYPNRPLLTLQKPIFEVEREIEEFKGPVCSLSDALVKFRVSMKPDIEFPTG